MTFAIRHHGLESPEALWRRNLRLDSLKLGAELHGPDARRPEMDPRRIAAGIIRPHEARHFHRVSAYGAMRAELPKSFRNGYTLAQVGPITAITNFNTGTTYNKLCDAIYLASSGDEIILPAGIGANNGSFIHYSQYAQLDSHSAGYTNSSDAMLFANPGRAFTSATYLSIVGIPSSNNLSSVTWANTSGGQLSATISGSPVTTYRQGQYVRISGATNTGTGGTVPGTLNSINCTFPVASVSGSTLVLTAPASAGVYGTIGGTPVLNNDRAKISTAIGYLTSVLNPGDTTIHLDDATDFSLNENRIGVWGFGDYTWQNEGMTFTGVTSNTLTGVSSGALTSPVPSGSVIGCIMPGAKALFTPGATNSIGVTMSNLELWGAGNTGSGAAIFGYSNDPGQGFGSLTANNLFIHDCVMGVRPGNSSVGAGVFFEMFNSELWRNGDFLTQRDHNAYILCDLAIFYNSLSWHTEGVHLFKSRSRTNYMMYSRTYSDHGSATNFANTWSANYDFPDAGLTYLIGCTMQQSLHDSVGAIRYGEEINYGSNQGELGTGNPSSEIYMVNCTVLAPTNGTGTNNSNSAPLTIGWPGLKNPEIPTVTGTAGGTLPARSYWLATTLLDSSGKESMPSTMFGNVPDQFNGARGVSAQYSISANQLALLSSPIPRTGGVTYNVYGAHADPVVWWNSGGATNIPPPTGPNQFFWDSAFTLPICVVNAGGSQPASLCYIGITYVFPEGESVNYALGGVNWFFVSSSSPAATTAAIISIPVNSLLTIKSPPAMAGATGWYPYVKPVAYNGGGVYGGPISAQVFSPIAIGTDWVQTTAFIQADVTRFNLYKQTATPIALGSPWTEPTTGLTNLNQTLLKWYRHGDQPDFALSKWFAVATGASTNYVVTAYPTSAGNGFLSVTMVASIQVWSGAATPFPFDADYQAAALSNGASATATTAATNTAVLAAFRNNATAGSGWNQVAALSFMMSEYKQFSSPQTGVAVTQTGAGAQYWLVEALAQKVAGTLAIRGTPQHFDGNVASIQFTIPTIAVGDVLIFDAAVGNGPDLGCIDPVGPPADLQSLNSSPLGAVVNNLSAYYNPADSGGWLQTYPYVVLFPGVAYPTVSSFNLLTNTYNGSGFNAPLIAAVWTDAANFDFTLAGGSPAINAGTNPGSGGGSSLVPTFQTSMIGTPTPGYPIAALTARSDMGVTLGAIGSGAIPPAPGPRMRWLRFGWDWKIVVAIGAVAIVENPTLTRRGMLLLTERATEPRERPGRSDPTGQYGVTSGLRKSHDRLPAESMRHDPRNRETDEP